LASGHKLLFASSWGVGESNCALVWFDGRRSCRWPEKARENPRLLAAELHIYSHLQFISNSTGLNSTSRFGLAISDVGVNSSWLIRSTILPVFSHGLTKHPRLWTQIIYQYQDASLAKRITRQQRFLIRPGPAPPHRMISRGVCSKVTPGFICTSQRCRFSPGFELLRPRRNLDWCATPHQTRDGPRLVFLNCPHEDYLP
jgi:hypothetical protein